MNKEFVPYKLALKLKELGFDEECFGFYTELQNLVIKENVKQQDCVAEKFIAPLWQQAFDWFREKQNLTAEQSIEEHRRRTDKKWMYSITWLNEDAMYTNSKITYTTYEEARQACLEKLIKIVKEL